MFKYVVELKMKKGWDRRTFRLEFVARDDEAASKTIREYHEAKIAQGWKLEESRLTGKETVH